MTRAAILLRAWSETPTVAFATRDGVNKLTATTGGATTVADTAALPPTGAATSFRQNWWLCRPNAANAADVKRIVSSYAAATQVITHAGPNYTANPLAGGDDGKYVVLREDIDIWNTALNEALRIECFFMRFDEWTPVSNTRRIYELAIAPVSVTDINRIAQIHNIQYHSVSEPANESLWRDWADGRREWSMVEDANGIFIDFRHVLPGTQQELRIVSSQPYSTLTAEDTATNVDTEWAAWATLLVMARQLADREDAQDPWLKIGIDVAEQVDDRRRQELGRYAFKEVAANETIRGSFAVIGRGGSSMVRGTTRRTFH